MDSEVRFGWIGESRRFAAQSLLAAQLTDWADQWWVDGAAADVAVRAASDDAKPDNKQHALLATTEVGSAVLHLGNKDFGAIGRHLVATSSIDDLELAARIGERALTDLVSRIYRRAGTGKPPELIRGDVPSGLQHSRLGAFVVDIAIGRFNMSLALDRRFMDRLVPPSMGKRVALTARQAALERVSLKLVASMDFGSVNLAQLSDLRVGEVLVGERGLDEALQIHIEGYGVVASGYLQRRGDQRAVLLDDLNSQEKKS
jgi:hypothetical protein